MERHIPKAQWGDGPWQNEPDELRWLDPETGLACYIWRHMKITGALNGYVGAPPAHPAHGLSYDGIPQPEFDAYIKHNREQLVRKDAKAVLESLTERPETIPGIGEAILAIQCHGGLTYAGTLPDTDPSLWWFGFDCAHAWDIAPAMDATLRRIHIDQGTTKADYLGYTRDAVYRDLNYVREQVTSLARQLKAMERPFVMPTTAKSNPKGE